MTITVIRRRMRRAKARLWPLPDLLVMAGAATAAVIEFQR